MSTDEKFESFLRQFRPRAPAPLSREAPRRRTMWMAAAAVGLLAVGGVTWLATKGGLSPRHDVTVPQPVDSSALTAGRLLRQTGFDEEALDSALSAGSSLVLPDVERSESALRALGRL
jgi:hypothetical protein